MLNISFLQSIFFASNTCSLCLQTKKFNHDMCYFCKDEIFKQIKLSKSTPKIAGNYTKIIYGGAYKYPLNKLIKLFKYQKDITLGKILIKFLVKKIDQNNLPEVLTFVPMHWKKKWQRGFNQSEVLCKYLAKKYNLPMQEIFCRTKHTKPLASMNKKEREQAVLSMYKIKNQPKFKHIAIIDDVLTSGSTMQQLIKLLNEKNIDNIEIWTIAK